LVHPVIQGVTQQTLGGPWCIFIDLGGIFGRSLDPLWAPFCDPPAILSAKMGDRSQVHVFGDPGTAVTTECRDLMCHSYRKNCVFLHDVATFLFHEISVPGVALGVFSVTLGDLWGTFSGS